MQSQQHFDANNMFAVEQHLFKIPILNPLWNECWNCNLSWRNLFFNECIAQSNVKNRYSISFQMIYRQRRRSKSRVAPLLPTNKMQWKTTSIDFSHPLKIICQKTSKTPPPTLLWVLITLDLYHYLLFLPFICHQKKYIIFRIVGGLRRRGVPHPRHGERKDRVAQSETPEASSALRHVPHGESPQRRLSLRKLRKLLQLVLTYIDFIIT